MAAVLVTVLSFIVTSASAADYSNYNSYMFQTSNDFPSKFSPFTIAVTNSSYCNVTQQLLFNTLSAEYKKLMSLGNITINITCDTIYSAPNTISQAKVFYNQLLSLQTDVHGVDALLGDYNPLVSTIAESLNLTFLIVSVENNTLNQRLQDIATMFAQSATGDIGPFADLNENTFVIESFWYRGFLYSSILGPLPSIGPQVFGSQFTKFEKLGIICDDPILLSEFLTVDRGPQVIEVLTTQLDNLYPADPDVLNNLTALQMDEWTSSYSSMTALLVATNTTYSMTILPMVLQSLLNTGFFNTETLAIFSNLYVDLQNFIEFTDTESSLFFTASTHTLGTYNFPFNSNNIALPAPQNLIVNAPVVYDPTVQSISASLYYVSMILLQYVYQPAYLNLVISTQNWPPVILKDGFIRQSVTYGVSEILYNRCQYLLNVLNVASSNCSATNYNASLVNILGYWNGQFLLTENDDAYVAVSNITSSTSTSTSPSIIVGSAILNQLLTVGVVIDNPFVISCEECSLGFQGYAIEILANLSSALKFTYNMTLFSDYSSMLRQVSLGHLDIGVGAILWTNNTAAEYGYNVQLVGPILDSGINLLMRNDTVIKWWSWFNPYSNIMWITLIVLMVLLIIAFIILDAIDPNRMGKPLFDFFSSYWYVFGSFTQSSVEIMPVTLGTKLMSMMMWFTVIIVLATYTAAYSSYLLNYLDLAFVLSVGDAFTYYQQYNVPFYFINNSLSALYIKSNFPQAYATAIGNPGKYIVNNVFDASARLLEDRSDSAFLGDARVNQWMANLVDCWLLAIGDIDGVASSFYSAMVMPINSSYYSEVNTELINLERFRVIPIMKHYYFDSQCSTSVIPQPLDLSDLAGLYMVLAGGTAVSLITVFLTLLLKKMRLSAARDSIMRQQRYHFNKCYVARVVVVKDSGMLIKVYRSERDYERDTIGKKTDSPPTQYLMTMDDLNVGNAKQKKPAEMHIKEGGKILVKFLGVNPKTDNDRFMFYRILQMPEELTA